MAGGCLVVLSAVATLAPLRGFGGGSCGGLFSSKTLPNGTRFNSVGPVNICTHATVHARALEVVGLLVLGCCIAALGAITARR